MSDHSPQQIQCHLNDQEGGVIRENLRDVLERIFNRIVALEAASGYTPPTRTWPGLGGTYYSLKDNLNPTAGMTHYLHWCLESTTPCLAFGMASSSNVVIAERNFDRWQVVPAAAGINQGSLIKNVSAGNPTGILYVPQGTGTQRGKFWVANNSNHTIMTIDPFNSYATSSFTLGASEANVTHMFYDSTNDRVFAITGGGTRICSIDPADGSNDAQSTGWTSLTHVLSTGSKLWLTKTSGLNTARLQYLDPTDVTLAATNPGLVIDGAEGITWLPEYDHIAVVVGGGANTVRFVDNTADTLTTTIDTGANMYSHGFRAWLPEIYTLVTGGVTTFRAIDIRSGCATSFVHHGTIGDQSNNITTTYYISEYKEVICCSGYFMWVFPSILG